MLAVKKVPWGLKAVVIVLVLRFLLIFLSNRLIIPLLGLNPFVFGSLIDRLFLTAVTIYIVFRFYRGDWKDLGLTWGKPARQLLLGLAVGVGLYILFQVGRNYLGAVMGQDLETHPLVKMARGAASPASFAVPLLLGGVMAPVAEEVFYRGLALPAMARLFGTLGGIVASAAFFAVMHFSLNWWPEVITAGVVFAYLYAKTKSLFPGMVAHAVVNSLQLLVTFLFK